MVVLLVLSVVCYLLAFTFHFITYRYHTPLSTPVQIAYNGAVIVCYFSLWFLLSDKVQKKRAHPTKSFWTTIVLGVVFYGIAWVVSSIGRPTGDLSSINALGFEYGTSVPLTLATVFKMNVLSLLEGSFAIYLLVRLRDLVLFKRTKSSQRNWYLMAGLMAVAALSTFMISPRSDLPIIQGIAHVPAVLFMVTNSFRLSWIVYLPFKDKMASIGLAFLLLCTLILLLVSGASGILPGGDEYVMFYSYPLRQFSLLSVVFGILYCTTTVLSLLFHLPTSGDFKQKVDEMAAMHSLTTLVSQVFESGNLAKTIVESPVEAGSAHKAWLAVPDLHSGSMRPRIIGCFGIASARVAEMVDYGAFYDEINLKREPILVEQAPADHRITARPGDGLGSLLVVPLITRDELLGALYVTKDVTFGFETDDVEAMGVFAAQAALALDHARLFEEQLEKERLARELDIAREVQQKLLPQALPRVEGVAIAASSISAQEVGGDYYDFIEIDENRLAIVTADVSGKGTHAAFYMAVMQGIFRSVSRLAPRPVEFLTLANEALMRSLERHIFISVIYGMLDIKNEEFVLARAGHCPAAMISLNGEARFLRTQGLGLGLDRSARFSETLVEERIKLQPGDVFVLYTDGVVESRNEDGEEYGYDRLLSALGEHRHEDAPDLHDSLIEDLRSFTGHQTFDDDMTLLVIKWQGIDLHSAAPIDDSIRKRHPEMLKVYS